MFSGEIPEALQGSIIASTTSNGSVEATTVSTRDISQALEYDGDTSSDADSAISDSTALSNNLSDSSFLHLSLPYSFENIDGNGEFPQLDDTQTSDDIRLNQTGTHDTASNSQIGRKSAEYLKARKGDKTSLYKCGYCMFSAHLRTMVKIHCQKQHPYKKVHVAELNKKNKHISKNRTEGAYKSETNDCANGAKGNSFNKHVGEESQLSNEDLMSKIAPLLRKDNTTSGNQMMVAKKSKTLKSVIDLLSSKVQCSENGGIPCETSVSSTNEVNSSPLNDSQVKLTQNAVHEEKSAVHSSSRKQRKPQHVIPNVIDDPDNNENVKSSCGVYPKCSSVSCEDVLDSASCEDALKDSINCANGPTADILCCENGPPVLTKALCDADVSHSDSIKEIDITPPLLVNEIAKVADVV